MNQLFVVPFFGLGRRVTLDVCFRLRPSDGPREDRKIIEFDMVWQKTPFEGFPDLVGKWSTTMLFTAKALNGMGYELAGAAPGLTLHKLISELESILWLIDCGFGEREAAVSEFLGLMALCQPDSNC